ncbi:MAG TPA: methylated-DNA--[protein]-cysteine S-methyltransferase [Acidimicrobiales bacterium]|nr:methylated-DNA--[protein]-cysteine S-methyltransferase [Acidimicrobiales bacterium]
MTQPPLRATLETPIGELVLEAIDRGLVRVGLPRAALFGEADPAAAGDAGAAAGDAGVAARSARRHLATAAEQLTRYFGGDPTDFCVPLWPAGTPFQRAVWQALAGIPYGTTVTYAEVARRVGRPAAFRAVGQANGANPLPIFLPCHRVVAARGKLGGYAGGLDVKRWLLELEGVPAPR